MTTTETKPDQTTIDRAFALLPPIFRRCVSPEARRYDLATPCVQNGKAYATDGCAMVWCPVNDVAAAVIAAARVGRFPNVEALKDHEPEFSDMAYPAPAAGDPPVCGDCKGAGKVRRAKCHECDGTGYAECCECGHESECDECDGLGYLVGKGGEAKCEGCRGTGFGERRGGKRVGGVLLSNHYLAVLHDAGAVLYPSAKDPAESMVKFVVPGTDIEGRLMPMREG